MRLKSRLTLILSAFCVSSTAGYVVRADAKYISTQADARKAIQAIYNRYSDAVSRRDVKAIFAIKEPGYVSVDLDGKVETQSQEEMRHYYTQLLATPNSVRETEQIDTLKLQGNTAIVTTNSRVNASLTFAKTGQTIMVRGTEVDRDYWEKSGGQWHWKRSRTLSRKTEQPSPPPPAA